MNLQFGNKKKPMGTDPQTMPSVECCLFIALAPVKTASSQYYPKSERNVIQRKSVIVHRVATLSVFFTIVTGAEQRKQTLHSHKTHKHWSMSPKKCESATPGGYSALFAMHISAFFARAALNQLPGGSNWKWVLKRVWANCSAQPAEKGRGKKIMRSAGKILGVMRNDRAWTPSIFFKKLSYENKSLRVVPATTAFNVCMKIVGFFQ